TPSSTKQPRTAAPAAPTKKRRATAPNTKASPATAKNGVAYVKAPKTKAAPAAATSANRQRVLPIVTSMNFIPLDNLESCQNKALVYVKSKAKDLHEAALPSLQAKMKALSGYSEADLLGCLKYIKEDAPIIIHLPKETLAEMVHDTHYRNCFETKSRDTTYQAIRLIWEKNMFDGAYQDSAPFYCPKYGCLNLSGDIEGCASARGYGPNFLTLKQNVRTRCTLWNEGSKLASDVQVATLEYYAHILAQYSDEELENLLRVCKQARLGGCRSNSETPKEVHIHGPIDLANDIQALSIPGRAEDATPEMMDIVLQFQVKTGCNVFWQQDLLGM
ncbi:MAG: hypothetical protein SGARI_003403, partial [Bacillariaceae sp.]